LSAAIFSPEMTPPRERLVAEAEQVIRAGSRSFRMASRLFDRRTRERAWLLYAWCRHCDDVCDGQSLGSAAMSPVPGSIEGLRLKTAAALRGENGLGAPFDGLARLLQECPVPAAFIQDHLEGFQLDADSWRPSDGADLVRYCYHVAGVVGCMMAVVMGIPAEEEPTLRRAADLGIAFQLANIARDVADDHRAGRCYLPQAWMDDAGVDPANPLDPCRRDALLAVVGRITDLAASYERAAEPGIHRLPMRARWAVFSAKSIYGGIGRKVAERGASAWDERVVVSRPAKLLSMIGGLGQALARS
jgi:phytoene synthase